MMKQRVAITAPWAILAAFMLIAPLVSHAKAVTQIRTGTASFYGTAFAGNKTANGESYDPQALTAASRTLPLGTRVHVTNRSNDRQVTVRINDRGPYHGNRIIDLSRRAAQELRMIDAGVARVRLKVLGDAQ